MTNANNYIRALTPCTDTKGRYSGKFYFEREYENEIFYRKEKIYIPWTTVKEIMKMIKETAESYDDYLSQIKEAGCEETYNRNTLADR